MKLSVLDQGVISKGNTPENTLAESLELAQKVEQWGYHRFWVAEHHNSSGLTSTSPEIMMTRIASETSRIKVGSGGILLPQYSPFKVAENAKTMAGFFPGRIDIGIGNSPGGSKITQAALTNHLQKTSHHFVDQVKDLKGFLHNTLPREHPFRLVKAGPRIEQIPSLWLLGLSEHTAKIAGQLGIGFVFGHFINPTFGKDSFRTYYDEFIPSENMNAPKSIVCVFVICASTMDEAEELAISQDHWLLNVSKGRSTILLPTEEIDRGSYLEEDHQTISNNRKRCIVGTPLLVKEQLQNLQRRYQADEIMIITNIYNKNAKLKSYQLVAKAFE